MDYATIAGFLVGGREGQQHRPCRHRQKAESSAFFPFLGCRLQLRDKDAKRVCVRQTYRHSEALLGVGGRQMPVVPEQEDAESQESKTSPEYMPHIAKAQRFPISDLPPLPTLA